MYNIWEIVQNVIEKHHKNKAVAVWAMNLFNNNGSLQNPQIRQKEASLNGFFVRVAPKEKDSIELTDSRDSISDSECDPTQ